MNSLQVSVLMPVYNESNEYLKQSIESILFQTYKNFELLIIDDSGENGRVNERLKNFAKKDKRIKIIKNKKNLGITLSLNKGIKESKGEFIVRMDADDISKKDRISKLVSRMLEKEELMLLGSEAELIDESSRRLGLRKRKYSYLEIRRSIFLNNQFIHPSVIIRKKVLDKIGGYNSDYPNAEDYDLFLRIALHYPCENLQEPLIQYRIHSHQITSKKWFSSRSSSLKVKAEHLFEDKMFFLTDMINFVLSLIIFPISPNLLRIIRGAR